MNIDSLDSSLSSLWVKDGQFNLNIYGNGIFFHKTNTTLRVIFVELESGFPDYLSYHLDKDRMSEYKRDHVGSRHILDISSYLQHPDELIEVENYTDPFDGTSVRGMVGTGDILGVISDGVSSFYNGISKMSWHQAVKDIIEFDNMFLQNRLSTLEMKWESEGIYHSDDIAVAAIKI